MNPRECCVNGPRSALPTSGEPREWLCRLLGSRASDGVPPQREGTGFYLDLRVFGVEMAVGVEITRVDASAKIIEFTYLSGGNTRGRQRMSFREHAGETLIQHETWFRCERRLRAWLYPAGHARTVRAFHANVARASGL